MRSTNAPPAPRLALVTGVSRRIGFALAERCAAAGFDLLVAAAEDCVDAAAARLRGHGGQVEAVRVDLADPDGVDELCDIARVLGRPVDALLIAPARPPAVAAIPAPSFLDQAPAAVADAFDRAVLGPVRLAHHIGRDMRRRGDGRILFACQAARAGAAVTSGANAFLAGFALALRQDLGGSGVTVTCLQELGDRPAPPTASPEAHTRRLAGFGFDAMMRGDLGLDLNLA